jgi:hypothetical protein
MYLSVVYMWGKRCNFLLVTQKETVPAHAAIDDDDLFGNVDDELGGELGGGGEETQRRGRRTALARKEDTMMSVLKEMNKQNEVANLTSSQILQVMRGDTPSAATPNHAASVDAMAAGYATTENGESLLNRTIHGEVHC